VEKEPSGTVLSGQIVEILPGGANISSSSHVEEDSEDEESDDSGLMGMKDMKAELAAFEESMTQFMRLSLLFSQISTTQFG